MKLTRFFSIVAACVATLLSACASAPDPTSTASAKPQIEFVDLSGFDRQLSSSLAAKLPSVNVAVAGSTPATDIPERMQAWLHAVEAGGGTVTVSPPQSTVVAKNPLILISIVSGIWNNIKAAKAVQTYELHKPAQTYNAEIVLKISEQGDRLIDKIIFTERKPS